MENMDITSFWSSDLTQVENLPNALLPSDGLDELFGDLASDLFKPNYVASNDDGSTIGDFEDWLDLKMDFSSLDCVQDQDTALNDLLVMEKDHVADLAPPQMEKRSIVHVSDLVSTYTPPSSPEGQVPDISLPISAVNVSNDHMFSPKSSTPPESPSYIPISFNSFTSSPSSPSTFLEVVIKEDRISQMPNDTPAPSNPSVSPRPEVLYVTLQEDASHAKKRSHPYAKSESKISVLKSRAKLPSGTSRAPTVTRKERKRVQNKDAATRYRQKKRLEVQTLEDEEGALQEDNQKLQVKVQQLSSEISYLKGLMKEMFRARGLLK